MLRFIALRLGQMVLAIFAASLIVFVLSRLGGDPVSLLLPATATQDQVAELRQELGLDKSYPEQYVIYLTNAVQGDLGDSIRFHRPAASVVLDKLPATLELAAAAFVPTVLLSIFAGVYAAARRDGPWDRFVSLGAAAGQSIPPFVLGTMLILIFAVELRWLPTSGRGSADQLVLPALTLACGTVAGLTRLTRSAMLETLRSDYIRFARVKGAPEAEVLWIHALRNALLTVLTFASLVMLTLLGGAVIVETVFAWPGVGSLVVESVTFGDYAVVQAAALVLAITYTVGNFIVDVTYAILDPRIRLA